MKISTKFLSAFIAAVMLITAIPFSASAENKSDIEDKIDYWENYIQKAEEGEATAQKLLNALDEQNDAISDSIAAKEKEIAPLRKKINELNEQISALEKRIKELVTEIADVEAKTEEQNKAIDETYEVLKKRLRAAYMAGETSELEIFLNATDFQDFLNRSELIRQISKHDNAIIKDLEGQIKELNSLLEQLSAKKTENEESKLKIEADRADVQSKKAVLDKDLASLEQQKNKIQSNLKKQGDLIEKYSNSIEYGEKQKAKEEKKLANWSAQMDSVASNTGSVGNGVINNGTVNHNFRVSSKGFICPIQDSSVYYSATFAQHSSRGTASVDLCAPARRYVYGNYYSTTNGAKIYAVASGTVTVSTFYSISGNTIMIDHGNGISTLYAHCKTVYVSAGQKVVQGQVIGLVGNTGSAVYPRPSTSNPVAGSHLHFETRLNGNRVNPEHYLPSPLV